MNERIKELALQVGAVYNDDHAVSLLDDEIEKFAQLIMQECLMKVRGAKIRGESIDTLIQNIKEDFGVEQ